MFMYICVYVYHICVFMCVPYMCHEYTIYIIYHISYIDHCLLEHQKAWVKDHDVEL